MAVDPAPEIEALSDRLLRLQHEYYVLGRPSVSDAEYDRLFDRLLLLEREHPGLRRPDSPTARVGSDLTGDFPEVRHSIPVLSLDKAYTTEEILAWIRKTAANLGRSLSFIVEEKIDGVSIVLYYESGRLVRAVTRGNGFVGNDVTANVRTIRSVPLRLSEPLDIAVRGEIFLPRERFEDINRRLETPYANPRNLAAGTLRRIRSSEVAAVPLDMFVYEGYRAGAPDTHAQILEELDRLGFRTNPRTGFFSENGRAEEKQRIHPTWSTGSFDDIAAFLRGEAELRGSLPYEIDGLVIKVNEIEARDRLGYTGHHPRWAVAWKFDAPEGITRVRDIEVQVGRTGRITPVARVEPVQVGGTTISNVTLHNQAYIDLLELAPGDVVAVSRRGDVIPAVERVIEKNEQGNPTWRIPEHCPSCGSELVQVGAHHFCPNPACPAQIYGRLLFFVGRGQMDIEGLGGETVELLLREGLVRRLSDLYAIDYERLITLPGFGEKKAAIIREGVDRSRERPFRTVLASLGIPELGQKAAELLVEGGFRDVEQLFDAAVRGDADALTAIDGIGPKIAETIIREFSDPALIEEIRLLRSHGVKFAEEETRAESDLPRTFAGQTWCVTGSFEHFAPRETAMEEVKKRGGRVTSQVSGSTSHLLAGGKAGSKLAKAKALGVTVVSEEEFLRLLEGNR